MPSATPSRPELRVGLLLDSLRVPNWTYQVVHEICNSSWATIVLSVLSVHHPSSRRENLRRFASKRRHLLYSLYSRFDNALFRDQPDAFAPRDLTALIGGRPTLRVTPDRTRYSDYLTSADVARIKDHDLDVALRFGFRILRGEVLHIAKHGIWSYHHGDNRVNRGGPPGFWEVLNAESTTGALLQILTESLDDGQVISRGTFATYPRSVRRNRNRYYWKSVPFVARKLKELHEAGPQALQTETTDALSPYSYPLYSKPVNRQLVTLLPGFLWHTAAQKAYETCRRKQWFVAYSLNPTGHGGLMPMYRFREMVPPRDRFWADPFPVKVGDRYFIFVEEYCYRRRAGHICVIEMDAKGRWSPPVKVLEKPYHLSYPFVFSWQDSYYMIPETAANRTIEIYRARDFPTQWELETVVRQETRAADTTLAQIDERWWMFSTIASGYAPDNNDELHLFSATHPLGPWRPHRKNPVKTDCRSSRPAGHLFRRGGQLYRPAQDCATRYGSAISVQRVVALDDATYHEEEAARVEPRWRSGLLATHTFNQTADLTVVDAMVLR